MGKKKHKKRAGRQGGWGENAFADSGNPGGTFNPGAASWNAMPDMDRGFLHNLQGMVGSRHTEQFILGALIGAAAVYVLGDEEMRNKLVKAGMKLYAGVAGGFEEIKEQMADIRAEVEAEQQGQ
ncbi:MAG: YtxH domain-containing protein [Dechloromonas sp.]|nr:MAG: YtxH domain-containing protein [Dechloromonas sp.]